MQHRILYRAALKKFKDNKKVFNAQDFQLRLSMGVIISRTTSLTTGANLMWVIQYNADIIMLKLFMIQHIPAQMEVHDKPTSDIK